ncbi:hypothetical protein FQA47_010494 [Oryzias melastigma]|uniref:Uncharacterized protein n=1 Tax=Oryzias melastigma TaxID=30732 RepID=A0A834CEJ2_ORYME|nr:hypothetical protein FQA47_010494 [Oryzias melastigma]
MMLPSEGIQVLIRCHKRRNNPSDGAGVLPCFQQRLAGPLTRRSGLFQVSSAPLSSPALPTAAETSAFITKHRITNSGKDVFGDIGASS